MANQTYEITIGSPILRPGVTITVRTSEPYAANAVGRLLAIAREINTPPEKTDQ